MDTLQSVRWDGKHTEIVWSEADGSTRVLKHPDRPGADLLAALAAFRPFAVGLAHLSDAWERADVRKVMIHREQESEYEGLQVVLILKVADAHNRPCALTTPYLRERGDAKAPTGYVPDDVMELLPALRAAAERYLNGERDQIALPLDETGEAKKPKRRAKGKGVKTADQYLPVANPDPGVPLTDELLRERLINAERDVPLDAIAQWTATEREEANAWAGAEAIKHGGGPGHTLTEPAHVKRAGTPSLADNGWTMPEPVRVTDDGQQAIVAAVEGEG